MRAHCIGIAFFQKGEDQLSVAKADEVAKLWNTLVSALQKDALRLCCGLNGKKVASGIYMVETATESGEKGIVCKIAIIR